MQSIATLRALATKQVLCRLPQPHRSLSSFSRRSIRQIPSQSLRNSAISRRFNSSLAVPESEVAKAPPNSQEPSYQLTFTCKPCSHRSSHKITKHGYHKGTVLIKCPSCKSHHVISDHLKIFMDEKSTLEDILRRKAGTDQDLTKLLKKGKLGMRQGEIVGREGDEDIEFWDDGTQTQHKPTDSSS